MTRACLRHPSLLLLTVLSLLLTDVGAARAAELADMKRAVRPRGLLAIHDHQLAAFPAAADTGKTKKNTVSGHVAQRVVETGDVVA